MLLNVAGFSGSGTVAVDGTAESDDDSKHPPHIHALDVQCSKTMMTINIEFNRAFDGVIYSKVNELGQRASTISTFALLLHCRVPCIFRDTL